MPMNSEIKAQWVKALRSGEYEQGRGVLARRHGDGKVTYCCLGVLCDLAVKAGIDIGVYESKLDSVTTYDDADTDLPASVRAWAGLEDSNPWVTYDDDDGSSENLAGLNDDGTSGNDDPWTFGQIADAIEAQL